MRGFTTVRDMGGPAFGLKRAIDEGVVRGPRIYPSGAIISHEPATGTFGSRSSCRGRSAARSTRGEESIAAIADSPDEVRLRVREQLLQGATRSSSWGVAGSARHTARSTSTFTEPELRAAVEAAANWGTYVTVHAYTPPSIHRAVAAGVKCIEHGHLMDEPTAKLLADQGLWSSLQPLTYDAEVFARMTPASQSKALKVFAGTEIAYKLARKYKIKTAFGADVLFDADAASRQGAYLAKLVRW